MFPIRSERIWIMDRGILTEETLASMRKSDAPLRYLVGTPKGRLTRIEAHIFVSFMAYCLLFILKNLARPQASGLTPRRTFQL